MCTNTTHVTHRYGITVLNTRKNEQHRLVELSNTRAVNRYIGNPSFKNLNFMGKEHAMVTLGKTKYTNHSLVQLGFTILQLAKLRIFSFIVMLDKYLDRSKYAIGMTDTDSLTLLLGETDIVDCVHEHLRQEFINGASWEYFVDAPGHTLTDEQLQQRTQQLGLCVCVRAIVQPLCVCGQASSKSSLDVTHLLPWHPNCTPCTAPRTTSSNSRPGVYAKNVRRLSMFLH